LSIDDYYAFSAIKHSGGRQTNWSSKVRQYRRRNDSLACGVEEEKLLTGRSADHERSTVGIESNETEGAQWAPTDCADGGGRILHINLLCAGSCYNRNKRQYRARSVLHMHACYSTGHNSFPSQ
jgi:hypothetical protein